MYSSPQDPVLRQRWCMIVAKIVMNIVSKGNSQEQQSRAVQKHIFQIHNLV